MSDVINEVMTGLRPGDPWVIADPGFPRWYHPRYVLPLKRVEQAVVEFCLTDGQQPASGDWAEDGGDHERLFLGPDQYRALNRTRD
ncbi:MAG TPA: hypothetical protein VHW44_25650 [Pseudonocardiaceae bacterium]|jgi:hypothetical protein|nr:hypothetical protein [Pseudonocardiaceae bacterium]